MKRFRICFCLFFSISTCFAQNISESITKRIDNKLYVIENNTKYVVDETKVIAKLMVQRELPKNLCRKGQDLGFDIITIPVPDSIKVEDYVSLLKHTGLFSFIEY